MSEPTNTNKLELIPCKELQAKAQAFNDARRAEGVEQMRKDICELVNKMANEAETTGEFKWRNRGLPVPEVFSTHGCGRDKFQIPQEVHTWVNEHGYEIFYQGTALYEIHPRRD